MLPALALPVPQEIQATRVRQVLVSRVLRAALLVPRVLPVLRVPRQEKLVPRVRLAVLLVRPDLRV